MAGTVAKNSMAFQFWTLVVSLTFASAMIGEIPLPSNLENCFRSFARQTSVSQTVGEAIGYHCNQQFSWQQTATNNWLRYNITQQEYEWFSSLLYLPNRQKRYAKKPEIRVRKELRTLTDRERRDYHRAIQLLKADTSIPPNKYDSFAALHTGLTTTASHGGPNFLGWHRVYLLMFENALRQKVPTVTVPYWASNMDSNMRDPTQSIVWSDVFFGNGNGLVRTGPFADWITRTGPLIRNIGESGGYLLRDDGIRNILRETRTAAITEPQAAPHNNIEFLHGRVHDYIDGQMSLLATSSLDPIFFCHHSFVDFIWETFRENQRRNGIDPETDFPDIVNHTLHSATAPLGFANLRNIDSYSNHFIDGIYRYEPVPSCAVNNRDCGSPFLRCEVNNSYAYCVSETTGLLARQPNLKPRDTHITPPGSNTMDGTRRVGIDNRQATSQGTRPQRQQNQQFQHQRPQPQSSTVSGAGGVNIEHRMSTGQSTQLQRQQFQQQFAQPVSSTMGGGGSVVGMAERHATGQSSHLPQQQFPHQPTKFGGRFQPLMDPNVMGRRKREIHSGPLSIVHSMLFSNMDNSAMAFANFMGTGHNSIQTDSVNWMGHGSSSSMNVIRPHTGNNGRQPDRMDGMTQTDARGTNHMSGAAQQNNAMPPVSTSRSGQNNAMPPVSTSRTGQTNANINMPTPLRSPSTFNPNFERRFFGGIIPNLLTPPAQLPANQTTNPPQCPAIPINQGFQNTYNINGRADIRQWVYLPVKIISRRPPNFRTYSSFPVRDGRVSEESDIYAPLAYAMLKEQFVAANLATTPTCQNGNADSGKVYVQSNGINYLGTYKEYAIVDRRLAISIATAFVAVKNPTEGATDVMLSAFDSCGRMCMPFCRIPESNTGETRPCSGAIRVTSAHPKLYGMDYGEAVMGAWSMMGTGEACPRLDNDHMFVSFYCDYVEKWPFVGTDTPVTTPAPLPDPEHVAPAMQVTVTVPMSPNVACHIGQGCVINDFCRPCINGVVRSCHGTCSLYVQCQGGMYRLRRCTDGQIFDFRYNECRAGSRECPEGEVTPALRNIQNFNPSSISTESSD